MPRIKDSLLKSVFYLYPTKEDAEAGERVGGTGFFVCVESDVFSDCPHIYAVSCKHVVKPKSSRDHPREPSPVIRLNTRDGRFDTLSLRVDQWKSYEEIYPNEAKHDLAIYEFPDPHAAHQIVSLSKEGFITQDRIKRENIGHGDDVVMIGRYIDHAGVARNLPSVRFGNISMMPSEPLWNPWEEIDEESFVVEMRSLSGYSGSPVFVQRPDFTLVGDRVVIDYSYLLLGIQWSSQPYNQYQADEGRIVQVYSGLGNVIPSWHIDYLLNWEDFKMNRKRKDADLAKEKEKKWTQVLENADREPESFTRDDFMRDFDKVVRIVPKKRRKGKRQK